MAKHRTREKWPSFAKLEKAGGLWKCPNCGDTDADLLTMTLHFQECDKKTADADSRAGNDIER